MDDDDNRDDDETISCPHCGEPMYDDSPRCPTCGEYVTSADFQKPFPGWLMWIIVITICGLLLPTLWPFLRRMF
jgi:hypothetical protein